MYQNIFNDFAIIFRSRNKYIISKVKNSENFKKGQFGVLFTIVKSPGITHKMVSEILNINKGTTTRAVQKLCKNNLVYIKQDPEDKRNHFVYPTEKGKEMKENMEKISKEWTEKVLEEFSQDEILLLSKYLERIKDKVSPCCRQE